MKKFVFAAAVALAVGLWGMSSLTNAQEGKKDGGHAGHDHAGHGHDGHAHGDMPDMAPITPSVEHRRLDQFVGNWKHESKFWMPGSPEPMIATGTSINKAILGGLAVTDEYTSKSEMGDFAGYGITTWNIDKQKYESYWFDVMSRYGATQMWGTYDEKTNQFTFKGESMCHDGTMQKMRAVHRFEGKDKHVFEMYMTGADGKEAKGMEITYTRVK